MALLLCKLALAPAFVVLISLAARRFGPRIGGVLGGLPVVAGPILFVIALEHGPAFAGEAATGSLAALVALTTFVVVVALLTTGGDAGEAAGRPAGASAALGRVLVGWSAFLAVAAIAAWAGAPPLVALAACAVAFPSAQRLLATRVAGRVGGADGLAAAGPVARPPHDLLLRAAAAAVMVLLLTSVAGALGPAVSGVLAPFPIITSVLAGFAVAHEPPAAVLGLLRGMLGGFWSFAAFLFVLAIGLDPLGTAAAFPLAIAATAAIQVVVLRRRAGAERPAPVAAAPVEV